MAWIAASDPAACPAKGPAADITSSPTQKRMALAIICRGTSPIPIGRHLSRGISPQVTKGINMAESLVTVDRQ